MRHLFSDHPVLSLALAMAIALAFSGLNSCAEAEAKQEKNCWQIGYKWHCEERQAHVPFEPYKPNKQTDCWWIGKKYHCETR